MKYLPGIGLLLLLLLTGVAAAELPLGKAGLTVEVAAAKKHNAPLLTVKRNGTELFHLQCAPHLYERKGVGWEGVGSDWLYADRIEHVTAEEPNAISADAVFAENSPGRRPYRFRYRVSVEPDKGTMTLTFLTFTGTGKTPIKLLTLALPLRAAPGIGRETTREKLLISGSGVVLEAGFRGKNGKFAHEILLTPPETLWLEKDVQWESFAPSIIFSVR